jgi:hypothetical protein
VNTPGHAVFILGAVPLSEGCCNKHPTTNGVNENNPDLFFHISGGWKFKIKGLAGLNPSHSSKGEHVLFVSFFL